MISVAVLEDDLYASKQLCSALETYGKRHACPLKIAAFDCADAFFCAYARALFDIIFLDIDLPDMNGMDAARRIRKADGQAVLVFTTNLSQYAIQGYEVRAMDYILKPIGYPVIELKMGRAVQFLKQRCGTAISISTRGGFVRLFSSSILYVEIYGHHIVYHTKGGDYGSYGTMKEVIGQLPAQGFFRTAASYVVNLQYVKKVEGLNVFVGEQCLPISRLRKAEFMEAVNRFFSGYPQWERTQRKEDGQ